MSRKCHANQLALRLAVVAILCVASRATDSRAQGAGRPVTVADMVRTTVVGDPETHQGQDLIHLAEFSPDERHVAVVVRHGNVDDNTVQSSILVFPTARLLRRAASDTIVSLASSSNRRAIAHVRWLADNATIAFLGEKPGELPQVYTVNIDTRRLTKLTNHPTVITTYDITPSGNAIAYTAEPAPDSLGVARRHSSRGYVVAATNPVDAIVDRVGLGFSDQKTHLFMKNLGTGALISIDDVGVGQCEDLFGITIAPTGDVAMRVCSVIHSPRHWLDYTVDRWTREGVADQNPGSLRQYMLADGGRGTMRPLLDAPLPWMGEPSFAWARDGSSIVLSNVYLPLGVSDPAERARRASTIALAEVNVVTGAVTPILQGDSLRIVRRDASTDLLVALHGTYRFSGPAVGFRKTGSRWERVALHGSEQPDPTRAVGGGVMLSLEQTPNTPPLLVATDLQSGARAVVLNPNPQFKTLRLGHVEPITWKSADGETWRGGLYYPPDYTAGKRYPLVIQTHGFDAKIFSLYGAFTTAFAAQPLAAQGIVVLQTKDPREEVVGTPREAPTAMAGYEGAIDHLDSLAVIDRARVGLIGFSRTCWYVKYTLTHSRYAFGAAAVTDGVDAGYLQYMLFSGPNQVYTDSTIGMPPFGSGLDVWRRESPGFNLDRVHTPFRTTALDPVSILGEWEWYAGLKRLAKPVEMDYIPDGLHELVKPWERLTSSEGNVDWFRFWLKSEEDPDPAKAEKYVRWRELRRLQQEEQRAAGDTTERQPGSN